VDGQDAETGLFTPVLQHPTSIQRHARGKSIVPGGDGFPLSRDSGPGANTGCVCCAPSAQRKGSLFHTVKNDLLTQHLVSSLLHFNKLVVTTCSLLTQLHVSSYLD